MDAETGPVKPIYPGDEASLRRIAREEIASLAGLMLRRLQDMGPTRSPERNMAVEISTELWGEVLRDFGGTDTEPGEE